MASVHIEKIGPAIDPCGTPNVIFKQSQNLELQSLDFRLLLPEI